MRFHGLILEYILDNIRDKYQPKKGYMKCAWVGEHGLIDTQLLQICSEYLDLLDLLGSWRSKRRLRYDLTSFGGFTHSNASTSILEKL